MMAMMLLPSMVFALVVAKGGPKELHDPAQRNNPHMEPGAVDPTGARHSNGLSRPFIDMTELKGSWDFGLVLPAWNKGEGPSRRSPHRANRRPDSGPHREKLATAN
jgi:hypothetical protein